MRAILLIATLLMLQGCMLWPNTTQEIPKLDGIVTENGNPVEGAIISLYASKHEKENKKPQAIIKTGKDGAFFFSGEKDFHLFITMGDPLSSWVIAINFNGKTYNGWSNFDMGYAKKSVSLSCELTAPEKNHEEGAGLCRAM